MRPDKVAITYTVIRYLCEHIEIVLLCLVFLNYALHGWLYQGFWEQPN